MNKTWKRARWSRIGCKVSTWRLSSLITQLIHEQVTSFIKLVLYHLISKECKVKSTPASSALKVPSSRDPAPIYFSFDCNMPICLLIDVPGDASTYLRLILFFKVPWSSLSHFNFSSFAIIHIAADWLQVLYQNNKLYLTRSGWICSF